MLQNIMYYIAGCLTGLGLATAVIAYYNYRLKKKYADIHFTVKEITKKP